jgi:glutathione S-transferase
MVMKLYSGPLSLYARKVEIALHEKQMTFQRVMVPFNQQVGYKPKDPDVLAANPKGQVPVLVDGDLTLYDSTVILEYLEDAYPATPLLPDLPKARARCRQLELFADEIMIVPIRALMQHTGPRPSDPQRWRDHEDAAATADRALRAQFSELDQLLLGREYLCERLSVADIAVFMMVLFVQRLGGPPLQDHAELSRWYAQLIQRPAFALIASEISQADKELSSPVRQEYSDLRWMFWTKCVQPYMHAAS